MVSSLPNGLLSFSLSIFLFALGSASPDKNHISYHNGPLLTGNISLSILWYGEFHPVEKTVVRTFIESLSADRSLSFQPDVNYWWKKVGSYLKLADKKRSPEGVVQIAREIDDQSASLGHVLGNESLPGLLDKASVGLANTVAVIFVAKGVKMQDTCNLPCYLHGVIGKQVYIVVGNPEEECPGLCTVPFHSSRILGMPVALTLEPPSGSIGADAMAIHFASALAETVTNPFGTGFFGGKTDHEYQVAWVCMGLFATGAFPGYPGNVRVDPFTGGAFNAHGLNSSKFLLPALWDTKNDHCWTVL